LRAPIVAQPHVLRGRLGARARNLAARLRRLYSVRIMAGKSRGRVKPEDLARRKKVGEFIRRRRLELNLSQGEMIRALGYKNRNSISNVEIGREGLPLRRIYQWADVLQLPREDFFRFVIGELQDVALTGFKRARIKDQSERALADGEQELIENYRRLSKKYQDRVREHVREYLVVESKEAIGGRRAVKKLRR
jgi:transcriptional regulator with XRE-family HTH domain